MASSALFGSPAEVKQANLLNPGQQNIQNQVFSRIQSLLAPGGGADFQPIAQQARRSFTENTIPGLAERFTSLGQGGAQRSSAFQGALGQAASGLESNLAAQQSQFGQNQLNSLLGFGLQPSTSSYYQPEEHGAIGELLAALAPSAGTAISAAAQSNPYVAAGTMGTTALLTLLKYLYGGR